MADDQKKEEVEESKESKIEEIQEASAAGDGEEGSRGVAGATEGSEDAPRETEPAGPASEPATTNEPKKASKPVEDTERSRSISANLEKIIEQIEKLSVLELADLVHGLEDRFGVSASAPIAVAPVGAGQAAGEPQEEKTTFNVILSATGANKIAVIKAVRELVPTLGLKEAKDLVEAAPKPVLEGVNKVNAEEAKVKLTAAGGTVELQ